MVSLCLAASASMASGLCWLTAASATTGTSCERATASVGKSPKPNSALPLPTSRMVVDELVPRWIDGDIDVLLREISLLLGDEEHRVIAAHDVVELDGDLVSRERRGAQRNGQRGRKR